jgi:ribosomal protein S18 acetylase RimI-like enzyme
VSVRQVVTTQPAIELVSAPESDRPSLFALARAAFGDFPGWDDRRVLHALSHDAVFVARDSGGLAGYVALTRVGGHVALVEQVLVAPGHEGRGVGRRLLGCAERYAVSEGAQKLQIVVEAGNRRARSFYRRCGFSAVGPELFERVLPSGR